MKPSSSPSSSSSSSSSSTASRLLRVFCATIIFVIIIAIIVMSSSSNNNNSSSSSISISDDQSQKWKDTLKKIDEIHDKLNGVKSPPLSSSSLASNKNNKYSSNRHVPPSSPLDKPKCIKPVVREEPTFPWKRGYKFPTNVTPLTMLRDGLAPLQPLPADWDGGYGWVFVKYHPSRWETEWAPKALPVERDRLTPLCDLFNYHFKHYKAVYTSQYHRFPADNGGKEKCDMNNFPPKEPMLFNDTVFSRFEYQWKCTRPPCRTPNKAGDPKIGDKKYSYIEPLVGLLRSPRACIVGDSLLNKNYMIVDPWPLTHVSRSTISPKDPKVIFLDGGASHWALGAGGASQNWFHRVYEGKCLNFTDWFMWESYKLDAQKQVFKPLPGHVKPGYRWYNIFLTTQAESWDNPINHLLLEATKEDVVIFKIDFDSPKVERALVQHILDHPQVAELIDEFYYEDHHNVETLRAPWRSGGFERHQSATLKLFTELRTRGIRAHGWV